VGTPGPPAAVGTCPPGAGGGGGAGGSGGSGGSDCVPLPTDVGGSGTTAVYWEEVYTCVDAARGCVESQTPVTLALLQDASEVDWEIVDGIGQGSEYSGELCDTSFVWTSKPGTASEDGCWELTADRFNKRSYGSGFFCVGAGSRGGGTTPAPVPTCAELAAVEVDYAECPQPPPQSPID